MKIHFIAVGGSAMHNLAIALHKKGHQVSGSDDKIFEPSKGRLKAYGLLPEKEGWNPAHITRDLDAVILGMHARKDNPELLKAQDLGLQLYSYPEYLYEQSKEKTRVVIGGSHGKTTITAMILHVLLQLGKDFDYMVGAQLDGFDTMVKLTDAPLIILEGDEYLSSPIDKRPKFHLYQANIGLISGIAWDHINVFPTYENYVKQFEIFAEGISGKGALVYCEADPEVEKVVKQSCKSKRIPYGTPEHVIRNGITYLQIGAREIPLDIFGVHNLQNMEGARKIVQLLGVSDEQFYHSIQSFGGASKRLERIGENAQTVVYKDFAHSPSKLKATTEAVKAQFPDRELVACMELHTFSSLNEQFLEEYMGTMDKADRAVVYFNPQTIAHKKLPVVSAQQVREAFGRRDLQVYTDSSLLKNDLLALNWKNRNLLIMTSGDFDGVDIEKLGSEVSGAR